jgi:hypothetical protein
MQWLKSIISAINFEFKNIFPNNHVLSQMLSQNELFFISFICGNHQGKKVTLGMHSLCNLSSLSQSSRPRKKKKGQTSF